MHLFGKANWHLPRVIERYLPRLSVEPTIKPGLVAKPALVAGRKAAGIGAEG
jgi:RND superfamily putative drug exporter